MTETPEIPEAAIEAGCVAMNSGVTTAHHRERWEPEVLTILTAALPHLNPEPTFTASEVKELTTKATEVALALGRKEAAEEILGAIMRLPLVNVDNFHIAPQKLRLAAAKIARDVASRPRQAVSNGLAAPTGHSDLPSTPECRGCGQDGTGLENHNRDCPRNPLADLPEGRDQ